MAIIKNISHNKCWWECGGKGTLIYYWQECKLVQLWSTVRRFLRKLKTGLPYDPVIEFLDIYLKECKPGYNKDTCTPIFIAELFTIAKIWKQPRCPKLTNRWRKCDYLYIYIYSHNETPLYNY
jgi:hypothetical protein